jgi:hypothetical protein
MAAHRLPDVTVVADAGMIAEANQKAIEAAGLSFILGMKVPTSPTWWASGAGSTRARRSPTGTYSPSPGRPGRRNRTLAGIKGYVANLAACPDGTPVTADFVISSYHELWNVEKSFRMARSDVQARPVYHRKRDSIEAHLTIVFAALAVSRWIEARTDWSIRKFVKTARRYRTIQIQAGHHTVTAADPIPDDLRQALNAINAPAEVRTNLS